MLSSSYLNKDLAQDYFAQAMRDTPAELHSRYREQREIIGKHPLNIARRYLERHDFCTLPPSFSEQDRKKLEALVLAWQEKTTVSPARARQT